MNLKEKTILCTGGGGFVGTYVCRYLVSIGVPVHRIISPRKNQFDLTRQADTDLLFQKTRPSVVIHLAARVGGIGYNRDHPFDCAYDNMAMGLNVIECAEHYDVEKIVAVSTVCAYPKFAPIPFKEEDLWNGYPEETNAPYGIAKKAVMELAKAAHAQCGLNAVNLLLVNCYGPGDDFDPSSSHVIPAMIRKFDAEVKCQRKAAGAKESGTGEVVLWGSGNASREFIYVEDAAVAIVKAAECVETPDPINVGSGHEVSISDLAKIIARECGYEGVIRWDTTKPDGQPRRCLDISKAETLMNFRAGTCLEYGIRQTVAWWREHGGKV